MSGEKDDDSVNNFKFLWDRWPVDDRTDILPMMNSVWWPLGEPFGDTEERVYSLILFHSFSFCLGIGCILVLIRYRFTKHSRNYMDPTGKD